MTERYIVDIEQLEKQELEGARLFAEIEKRVIIGIVGMGGKLIHKLHDEYIFEIPVGTNFEDIKKLLCTGQIDCPCCEPKLPTVEALVFGNDSPLRIFDTIEEIIINGTGIMAPIGLLNADLHSVIDRVETLREMAKPIEFMSPPKKKNVIPKPYGRKGKFKYGWK